MNDVIVKHANMVVELRRTLSVTERELAHMVVRYVERGGSLMDFDTATYGAINLRLVDAAKKRLKAAA